MGEKANHLMDKGTAEEVTVKEVIVATQLWIKYLWTRKVIWLFAGVLGGVLGFCYVLVKEPVYTATTTFVVESSDSRGRLGGLAGMAAMAGLDFSGNAGGLFQGDNIMELYRSRRMLGQALFTKVDLNSSELLIERYISYNKIRDHWQDQPELLALDFRMDPSTLDTRSLRLRDSIVMNFVNTIRESVLTINKPEKNLSIVRVDVASPDEIFSKSFNENLVRQVNDFYIQTKVKKSSVNIQMLEAKVDSVRAVMAEAIYSAAQVSDATPNLNPTRQVNRIGPVQEAQFSAEANRAMLSQLLQNLELAKITMMQEQPLIQIVDQPIYPLPLDRISKAKAIFVGAFLFCFFTLIVLIGIRWYYQIMEVEDNGKERSNTIRQ